MNILIVIPMYIQEDQPGIDLIIDQIYVAIESFYHQGNNWGRFLIITNSDVIIGAINLYNKVYDRAVETQSIDFDQEWKKAGLEFGKQKEKKEVIIPKMILPFILDEDYLLYDLDILTTGYIDPNILISEKIRAFNPRDYDGQNVRQISIWKGLTPEGADIGLFKWINTGFTYFPLQLSKTLIKEYWDKFNGITEQVYRGIYLFDILGDELIYNLMKIDKEKRIEIETRYNLNVVFRNFCCYFSDLPDMFNFGKYPSQILNVHFAGGHVKPYDVFLNEKDTLSYTIKMEKYALTNDVIRWGFSMDDHRTGSFHYTALIFSIIWQYYRYSIKENLGLLKGDVQSKRYVDFYENCLKVKKNG